MVLYYTFTLIFLQICFISGGKSKQLPCIFSIDLKPTMPIKNLPALSNFTCCFWLSKGHLPITAGGRWLFTIATSSSSNEFGLHYDDTGV
ncbi:hypothetical protein EB796_011592 [Bugula neritina]|uniref:Secreted protein n=1 Tax=Bugula neritina TaxID=10212 RepID=A0A7J7JUQ7_BUGNE|nr:hypothetical protein EB796_011592 [Bugula neritina]